ncbi:tetratricopeptide repeat protein [Flavobacteriaceae bacterium S356]|uniref:Tetratricopeptide repeat protein n=1 Tax=Asprobacillus argus TaxID=3076534 RepID=A0ABU3LEA6_9FLAO|nr:tetratricopeptide repeat protein [Flavobacteriaceae bacterium S356]
MATYKKRGYKPKDKKEQQAQDMQSTTAEVFNTLDETASKSEQWIEKNSKPLFYGLTLIAVIILGFLGYNKFIAEPAEIQAANDLAFPRKYFDEASLAGSGVDSLLTLSLDGANGKYGFLDIISEHGGTKAGNLANYYAGMAYLQLKDYQKAIDHLEDFSSDDEALGPIALGAIGDAFSDLNQEQDALTYYEKAANKKDNEYTSPLFLFKAGNVAMNLKQYDKALSLFTKIKENYPKSEQGNDIDKYISMVKYAQ